MSLKARTMTALAAVMVVLVAGPVLADGAAGAPAAAPAAATPASATPAAATPAAATPASADDAFLAKVRTAIVNHDIDLFDKQLIDWDGARKRTQRLTLFQLRECFSRPIKSVTMEPLKLDPGVPLVPEGYKTNLPVTHLLRITFDEKHAPEETPACVFMLSKDPAASYRIALVLSTAPPPK